jgi:hypothetical protein
MFGEMIALYSENQMKLVNNLCGKVQKFVDINAGGTRIKGDMRRGVKSAVGTER